MHAFTTQKNQLKTHQNHSKLMIYTCMLTQSAKKKKF